MRYRYRPAENRTPVNDPVIGHLCWDGVYDHPACAKDRRFKAIKDDEPAATEDQTAGADAPTDDTATPNSAGVGESTEPTASRRSGARKGRSTK